jgi:hypothetical protein
MFVVNATRAVRKPAGLRLAHATPAGQPAAHATPAGQPADLCTTLIHCDPPSGRRALLILRPAKPNVVATAASSLKNASRLRWRRLASTASNDRCRHKQNVSVTAQFSRNGHSHGLYFAVKPGREVATPYSSLALRKVAAWAAGEPRKVAPFLSGVHAGRNFGLGSPSTTSHNVYNT